MNERFPDILQAILQVILQAGTDCPTALHMAALTA
jgi:hypothetical protein